MLQEKDFLTDKKAPLNVYSIDWDEISQKYREQQNYTCENCQINLSHSKKYLHVHHINEVKSDNDFNNLKVLCIKCHAEQPNHEHLKKELDYKQFKLLL